MLVINSNNPQEWFIISNSQLGVYPDLKNNLFLSLDTLLDVAINSTPANANAVETIWGTNINRYAARFLMPEYLTWLNSWGNVQPIGILCNDTAHMGNYTPVTIRAWLEFWFKWGEKVWDEIIWWGVVGMLASSTSNNYGNWAINSIIFTVQLLHSDWTLTQIAQQTLLSQETWRGGTDLGEVWKTIPSNTAVHYAKGAAARLSIQPTKTTQTWITATEWDRLVLDINYSWKISNAVTTGCWLFFGYKYSSDDSLRFMPTQVSIR